MLPAKLPDTADPRLAAYADCDEANSAIGVAIALGELSQDLVELLTRIQNDLFDLGAEVLELLARLGRLHGDLRHHPG